MAPKKFDQSLIDFDRQLSAMSLPVRERSILAVEDKAKIIECLSEKAPISLVKKFAKRIDEVAELIEAQFSLFEKSRLAQAQDRFEEEEELLRKAVEMGSPEAYECLGLIAFDENHKDEAKELLEKAVELGNPEALVTLSLIASEKNDTRKERMLLIKAAKMGVADAYWSLGCRAACIDKNEIAKIFFRKAAKMGVADAYMDLCEYVQDEGKTDEAKELYKKAAEMGFTKGYVKLSRLALKEGKTEMAKALMNHAAEMGDLSPLFWLCSTNEESKELLAIAAELEIPEAYFGLGSIAREEGRVEEAIELLKRAAEMGVTLAQKELDSLLAEKSIA